MQLTLETDYAIRSLLYLSGKEETVSAREIGHAIALKWEHAQKILRKLHKHGLVSAVYGRQGGYRLNRRPEEISLYDILCVMENKIVINRCLEEDHFCSRPDVHDCMECPVHRFYLRVQNDLENTFRGTTLQDLLDSPSSLEETEVPSPSSSSGQTGSISSPTSSDNTV